MLPVIGRVKDVSGVAVMNLRDTFKLVSSVSAALFNCPRAEYPVGVAIAQAGFRAFDPTMTVMMT